ncbi:MAG: hypothetical protein GF355_14130, partial [Candidatus Eisenbacteria bacterium]|nr:hypothetical protein [Candidatus Eisenbacteria bacterium]
YIQSLLQHAHQRINLDLKSAKKTLERFPKNLQDKWRISGEGKWAVQRLRELIDIAHIHWNRGHYISFFVVAAGFCETARKQLVGIIAGVKIGMFVTEDELRRANLGMLHVHMKEKGLFRGGRAKGTARVVNTVMKWLLDHPSTSEAKKQVMIASRIMKRLEGLRELEEIRNRIVHDLEGISKDEANQAQRRFSSESREIVGDMIRIAKLAERSRAGSRDIYANMNALIMEKLTACQPDERGANPEHSSLQRSHRDVGE